MDEREQLCGDLDELLEVYSDTVYRVALQSTGDTTDVQDVIQNVFLRILKRRLQFTSATHEKAWILRVTVNICKGYWKYQRLRRTVELQGNLVKMKKNTDSGLLYEVMQLSAEYRNVIYLFYYEELGVAMIAGTL